VVVGVSAEFERGGGCVVLALGLVQVGDVLLFALA